MAFLGMLGHLAHPVTTPVWGRDKCSFAPASRTWSGQHTHVHTAAWAPYTRHNSTGVGVLEWTEMASLGLAYRENCVVENV